MSVPLIRYAGYDGSRSAAFDGKNTAFTGKEIRASHLFEQGNDTFDIARIMEIEEHEALALITSARGKRRYV